MAVLSVYVDDRDFAMLQSVANATGRTVEDLAESAISEAACRSRRHYIQQPPSLDV